LRPAKNFVKKNTNSQIQSIDNPSVASLEFHNQPGHQFSRGFLGVFGVRQAGVGSCEVSTMSPPDSTDPDKLPKDGKLDPEDLPPIAAGMAWVSRITTISLEMVLPALGGWWLDQKFGTQFWIIVGMMCGLVLGFWHLMKITRALPGDSPGKVDQSRPDQKSKSKGL
jgi:hypothetical protein